MITKKLENIIEKYKITETNNIIYDTNIHILILGKMTIKTKEDTYNFQINRFVVNVHG